MQVTFSCTPHARRPCRRVPDGVHLLRPNRRTFARIDQERGWYPAEGLLMQSRNAGMGTLPVTSAPKGAANRHLDRMKELIKGRSDTVRARMVAERGLPREAANVKPLAAPALA